MLILLLLLSCQAKLVYFTEVCRHGARAPKYFMPWDSDERWPNGSKNLVNEGLRQHYLLGLYLRKRYIIDTKFLSDFYDSTELKVYSTSVTRTIFSIESQLMGLYPQKEINFSSIIQTPGLEKYTSGGKKPLIPIYLNENKIEPMLLIEDYCKPYNEDVKLRKPYLDGFKQLKTYQDASDTVESYFKENNQQINSHLLRVFGSVISNKFMGYSIPSVFDDDWFNKTQDLHIKINEFLKYENEYSKKLAGSEFLNLLLEQFELKIQGKRKRKATIYSAHDTTLMNIFATLNIPISEQPPFASILIFELHEIQNDYFIQTVFNDLPLTLPFCSTIFCEYSSFKSFILTHTFKNVTEACLNFPSSINYIAEPIMKSFSKENSQKPFDKFEENQFL